MPSDIEKLDREIAELKARARDKRQALARSLSGLDESVHQLKEETQSDIHRLSENVHNKLSLQHQVKAHPSGALIGAFVVGVASAFLLPGGKLRMGASLGRLSSSYMKGAVGSTLMLSAFDILRDAAENKAPSSFRPAVDRFFARIRSDLHLDRRSDPPKRTFTQAGGFTSPGNNGSELLNQ